VDLTQRANLDGRAAELADVAFYVCPECTHRGMKGRLGKIGNYQLLSELGRGGMGVVYKAAHIDSGRLVALKQLLPIAKADKHLVKRFMREAMIMEQFKHSALVWIYETGLEGIHPYIVSEFVPNGDFNQFMTPNDKPRLPPEEITSLIAEALVGLAVLHTDGYVHRDIKPENILIRQENGARQPKLADFGLARSYEKHGGTITRKGEYAGTIFYMPQEQITNFKRVHPPSDIYSMGVTLYYLLSGRFSLNFPTPSEIKSGKAVLTKDPIRMILEDEPVPLRDRRADLPRSLCLMVDRAVRKEAAERYQSAEEFRQELLAYLDNGNKRWMD
jgi:serine/threonine-protein kinase